MIVENYSSSDDDLPINHRLVWEQGAGIDAGGSDEEWSAPRSFFDDPLLNLAPPIPHSVRYRAALFRESHQGTEWSGTVYIDCPLPVYKHFRAGLPQVGQGSSFILYPHPDSPEGGGHITRVKDWCRIRGELTQVGSELTVRHIIAFNAQLQPGTHEIHTESDNRSYLGQLTMHRDRLSLFKM